MGRAGSTPAKLKVLGLQVNVSDLKSGGKLSALSWQVDN